MATLDTAFVDVLSFQDPPRKQTKKRGPRVALDDDQLQNRRDQLVQAFEGKWAEIEPALKECKSPDELSRILRPLGDTFARDSVSSFLNPSVGAFGAPNGLRGVRRDLRKI